MNLYQNNNYIFSDNLRRYARQVGGSYIIGECLIEVIEEDPFFGFSAPPSRFEQDGSYTTTPLSVNGFKGKLAIQELSKSELVDEPQMKDWLCHDEALIPDKRFEIPDEELEILIHHSAQYKLFALMALKLRDMLDKSRTGFVDKCESKKAILDEPIVQDDMRNWQLGAYRAFPSISEQDVKILLKDEMLVGDSSMYHINEKAYFAFMEKRYQSIS